MSAAFQGAAETPTAQKNGRASGPTPPPPGAVYYFAEAVEAAQKKMRVLVRRDKDPLQRLPGLRRGLALPRPETHSRRIVSGYRRNYFSGRALRGPDGPGQTAPSE